MNVSKIAAVPMLSGFAVVAYAFVYTQPYIWLAIALGWIGLSLIFTSIYMQSAFAVKQRSDDYSSRNDQDTKIAEDETKPVQSYVKPYQPSYNQ